MVDAAVIRADLIISKASELLVCPSGSNSLGMIREGAVACLGGKIVWVGSGALLEEEVRLLPGGQYIDAGGHVVMPGAVDCHTHLGFGGDRTDEFQLRLSGASYQEIALAGGGIMSTVRATRDSGDEVLLASCLRRLDRYVSHGVTTIEAKTGYGLSREEEIRMLEIYREADKGHPVDIVPTLLAAHAVPTEYAGRADEYVDMIVSKLIPYVAKHGLAKFCDAFLEVGGFSKQQCRAVLSAGLKHGLSAKLHADQLSSMGGAEFAAEMGVVSVDHLDLISESGIAALAAAEADPSRVGPVAVLLPGATFFLAEGGLAPGRALIDAGVRVALSTDFNPGSSPTQNLWLMGAMGCTELGMSIVESIRAITVEAAAAVGLESEVGSLEVGKKADVLILEHRRHEEIPYRYGMNPVIQVYKNGKLIARRGPIREV